MNMSAALVLRDTYLVEPALPTVRGERRMERERVWSSFSRCEIRLPKNCHDSCGFRVNSKSNTAVLVE